MKVIQTICGKVQETNKFSTLHPQNKTHFLFHSLFFFGASRHSPLFLLKRNHKPFSLLPFKMPKSLLRLHFLPLDLFLLPLIPTFSIFPHQKHLSFFSFSFPNCQLCSHFCQKNCPPLLLPSSNPKLPASMPSSNFFFYNQPRHGETIGSSWDGQAFSRSCRLSWRVADGQAGLLQLEHAVDASRCVPTVWVRPRLESLNYKPRASHAEVDEQRR